MPENHKTLAERLRAARLRRLMTQDELAEASGIGRATIARLETGEQHPQIRTVRALARALEIDPAELVPDPEIEWSRHRQEDS